MNNYTETDELLKIDDILKKLTKDQKVGLIHHTDPDGVCSGVLLAKLIETLRKKPIDFRHNQKSNEIEITKESINLVKQHNLDILFITDMASDQNPDAIKQLEQQCKVIIIDHHPLLNNVKSNQTILHKAQDISQIPPVQYCTSKMVYDLGQRHTDMEQWDWICAMGVIADRAHESWKEFLNTTYKKYNLNNSPPFSKTRLGLLANMLSQTEAYDINEVKTAFDILYKSESFKDVEHSIIKEFASKVDQEITTKANTCEQWCEVDEDNELIMGKVESPYVIKSNLTTVLAELHPNKTVVLYQLTQNNNYTLSIRRADGQVKVNDIIVNATNEFNNISAGGHTTNAGGTIPQQYITKVLENIKQELSKIKLIS